MTISKGLYKALESKYSASIDDAKVRMAIYFENSVAIGEHPQHLEEMDTLVEKMAAAEDKLSILQNHFPDTN